MEVREQILKEALSLFGQHGYTATSTQSIADAVGIKKQSLFHHFKSKEDLRKAVSSKLLDHWQEELPRLVADASSGANRFSNTMEALVDFLMEDANRAKQAVREMLDRPAIARELMTEKLKPWTTLLVNYIRLGQDTGFVRADVDPDSYITLILTMAIGAVAFGPVASVISDDEYDYDHETMTPKIKELVRIAGSSLFYETPTKK